MLRIDYCIGPFHIITSFDATVIECVYGSCTFAYYVFLMKVHSWWCAASSCRVEHIIQVIKIYLSSLGTLQCTHKIHVN